MFPVHAAFSRATRALGPVARTRRVKRRLRETARNTASTFPRRCAAGLRVPGRLFVLAKKHHTL
jgi:hypothetical protein